MNLDKRDEQQHLSAWKARTLYCGEFIHDGGKWALDIFAVDAADAERKAQSVRNTFRILGSLEGVVPCQDDSHK